MKVLHADASKRIVLPGDESLAHSAWLPALVSEDCLILTRVRPPAPMPKPAGTLAAVAHWPVKGDPDMPLGWEGWE